MFDKLYKKIYYPFFILTIALIVFIDVMAAFVQVSTLTDTYKVMGEKKLTQIMNSLKLYISSAETSTYNLSLDETVIEELYSPSGESLMRRLEDTCNYSLKINAIYAYSQTGEVFTSSTVAQVPELEELRKDDGIAAFLDGDELDYISLRTSNMAGIYGNTRYDEKMGVITCCRKVLKDGEVVGWIFTDILPSNLYSYVFGEGLFGDAIAFIVSDCGYFSYNNNSNHEELLSSTKNRDYFRYSSTSEDGLYTLTIFDGKTEYYGKLAGMLSLMGAVTVILIVAVHFGSRAIARSVTVRLDKFLARMNAQELP